MAGNAFDSLLETIGDETDRKALATLGQKYPEVRDGRLRQDDYSRKMDGIRAQEAYVKSWDDWQAKYWLPEKEMTRAEWEKEQEIVTLKQALAKAGTEGDQVNFDQLHAILAEKKVVTADQIAGHMKPLSDQLDTKAETYGKTLGLLVSKTMPLMFRHQTQYGEILDIDKMFSAANGAGVTDIDRAYEMYTAPQREAKAKADLEKIQKESYDRGKSEALRDRVLNGSGEAQMPVDMGGPSMGHFERTMFQQQSQEEKAANVVPDEIPLGQGVSRFVAQAYRKQAAERQVAGQ